MKSSVALCHTGLLHCFVDDVVNLLSELKPSRSSGPDQIHPMILKNCSQTFAHSLSKIFNMSFSLGILLTKWKLADITPLHKKVPRVVVKTIVQYLTPN